MKLKLISTDYESCMHLPHQLQLTLLSLLFNELHLHIFKLGCLTQALCLKTCWFRSLFYRLNIFFSSFSSLLKFCLLRKASFTWSHNLKTIFNVSYLEASFYHSIKVCNISIFFYKISFIMFYYYFSLNCKCSHIFGSHIFNLKLYQIHHSLQYRE